MFRDISTLMLEPGAFAKVTDAFAEHYKNKNIDCIAGNSSRGRDP